MKKYYQGLYELEEIKDASLVASAVNPIPFVDRHKGHLGLYRALEDGPKFVRGQVLLIPKIFAWGKTREKMLAEGKWACYHQDGRPPMVQI